MHYLPGVIKQEAVFKFCFMANKLTHATKAKETEEPQIST